MTACDDKLLLLQAHVDGELDAANAVALEAHLRSCTACADELARIEAVRGILASAEPGYRAPEGLRSRIDALIDAEAQAAPGPSARRPVERTPEFHPSAGVMAINRNWGGGLATGLALSAALLFALPQLIRSNTEDQLIDSHIRSLSLSSHLTDIATSNRHVVKPWFNGKIDFAPPVPELAAKGFPLVGGRLDYVDGHEAAAIVYRRRLHTINVFVLPAGKLSLPVSMSSKHEGYSVVRWTKNGLAFWAISDIDLADLELFQRTFVSEPSL